jgi:hypothetical protein
MKHLSLLTTLLLPLLSLADSSDGPPGNATGHQHGGKGNGARRMTVCDRFLHAENIIRINANQTEMARIEAQNPKRAQRIQAESANATSFVNEVQGNKTLVAECSAEQARHMEARQCARLRHLEAQANDATNATRQAEAKTKLLQLESNQTLVNECKNEGSKGKDGKGGQTASGEFLRWVWRVS